jgi:hypothetical protein
MYRFKDAPDSIRVARYLRLSLDSDMPDNYWRIHELEVK